MDGEASLVNNTSLPPTYFTLHYKLLGVLFHILILIVGVISNLIVILVLRKRWRLCGDDSNRYLASLAAADILLLLSTIPNEVSSYFLLVNQWIWGEAGCSIFVYLQYFSLNMSSVSILLFALHLYMSLHKSTASTNHLILVTWILLAVYNLPWLFLTTTKPIPYRYHEEVEMCTFKLDRNKYIPIYLADFIIFYVSPTLACIKMYRSVKSTFNVPVNSNSLDIDVYSRDPANQLSNCKKQLFQQLNKVLLVLIISFATLLFPYRSLVVYNSFATQPSRDFWYLMFCKVAVFINATIKPFCYYALSIHLRHALHCHFLWRCNINNVNTDGFKKRPLLLLAVFGEQLGMSTVPTVSSSVKPSSTSLSDVSVEEFVP